MSPSTLPAGLLPRMTGKHRLPKMIYVLVESSKPRWQPKIKARASTSRDFIRAVKEYRLIEYDLDDGRHVRVEFTKVPGGVKVVETFDPENENPEEMQRSGWQAILDNFKKYVESNK